MNVEERVGRVEEAILIMKDLLVSHNGQLDDYFIALENERQHRKESREDFDFKMNAVIVAQMQNEIDIREVKGSIIELKNSITEVKDSISGLADASKSQLGRIENLENK